MLTQHLDALGFDLTPQMLAHIVVEAAQNLFAAIRQRHLGAEALEDPGKLHGNVAATHHQHAPR